MPQDDAVPEGTDLVYNVSLSNASTTATTFTFSLGGGSASADDYGTPVFSHGVILNSNGTITVPAGVTSFTVTVPTVDDLLYETTETVPLTIGGVSATGVIIDNDNPAAVNDTVTVEEDSGPTVIDVLGNDSLNPATGQPLTISGVTQGANGTVTLTPAGVVYTPDANFNGNDSFTYTITDDDGRTSTAQVNVVVTPVNDAPVAVDDSLTIQEDGVLTITPASLFRRRWNGCRERLRHRFRGIHFYQNNQPAIRRHAAAG